MATEEFRLILKQFEDAYLALEWKEQRAYLIRPLEIDLRDIAHRVLGV